MTGKTPEYTKNAIQRYNAKFDRIAVNLPKGTKERIKNVVGDSCNAYISALVLEDLHKRESTRGAGENIPIKDNPVDDPANGEQVHAETAGKSQEYRPPTPEELNNLEKLLNKKKDEYNNTVKE